MSATNTFAVRDADGSRSSLEVRFASSPLSGSRRRLIREILDNHEQTFFLSSREMAKRYNVDATTILRTTQVLGYKSFADFSTDLRQHFVARSIDIAGTHDGPLERGLLDEQLCRALLGRNVCAGEIRGELELPDRHCESRGREAQWRPCRIEPKALINTARKATAIRL